MKCVINCFLIGIVFIMFSCKNENKYAYVELAKLFDEFEYTKDLKKEINQVNEKRKFVLDSIAQNLEIEYKKYPNKSNVDDDFKRKVEEFKELKYRFKSSEEEISKSYDEKIYKQINQYVKEYGELNHYSLILGANGSGNVMYADSTMNITSNLIDFINKKYKGK